MIGMALMAWPPIVSWVLDLKARWEGADGVDRLPLLVLMAVSFVAGLLMFLLAAGMTTFGVCS